MKSVRKPVTVAPALPLTLSLVACGAENSSNSSLTADREKKQNAVYCTLDETKRSGTINIGVFSSKSSFSYIDKNGECRGYDIYLVNRIGGDLDVKINYVSTKTANRVEHLQASKADIVLANFTVAPQRAEEVDLALPYMNVVLGVISPDGRVIESLDSWNMEDQIIVIPGTVAETYSAENCLGTPLQEYGSYVATKNALENGNGVARVNDNTEVIALALQNDGYTVGIPLLGSRDSTVPAISKDNGTLLDWLDEEIVSLGEEQFFHVVYKATLTDTYGSGYEDSLVVEGGRKNK